MHPVLIRRTAPCARRRDRKESGSFPNCFRRWHIEPGGEFSSFCEILKAGIAVDGESTPQISEAEYFERMGHNRDGVVEDSAEAAPRPGEQGQENP